LERARPTGIPYGEWWCAAIGASAPLLERSAKLVHSKLDLEVRGAGFEIANKGLAGC